MTPPMLGTRDVLVLAARPFTIHGDEYLELAVRPTDTPADGDGVLRVPAHAWKAPPAPGDRVRLTFLMGQVTRVDAL